MAKLVKNSKVVKIPRTSGSVNGTLKKALQKAKDQKWKNVIIIGEGKDNGAWMCSKMSQNTQYGMIEKTKFLMLMADYNE